MVGTMAGDRLSISDPAVETLDEFAGAVEESATEQRALAKRARRLGRAWARGSSWSDAVANDGDPALPAESTRLVARLTSANSKVRRALAQALRAEGMGIEQIARFFGVTHQRISRILAQRQE
jgi:ABC-type transporter Mla subunit MlaD